MADIDDKTQKLIDKAVKTARKDVLKSVNQVLADRATEAKDLDGEGKAKTLVTAEIKAIKAAIKDATAE